MLFKAVTITEVGVNPGTKIRDVVSPKVPLKVASIVGKATTKVVVQHLVKSAPNVAKRTISKLCVKVVQMIDETKVGLGPRRDLKRAKSSMR